jgi:hypothetical protein
MSAHVCIKDLVKHIVVETERLMKGTQHKDDWMFYHDALTLMTAKETIVWMKRRGILSGGFYQLMACILTTLL